ncbi:MAG TPA: nucleotidyltransferase family protein [Vicinamibacteria bacterium]|nr:nucleotidyltransferase family protein [Vicinamibacteria bacterium]
MSSLPAPETALLRALVRSSSEKEPIAAPAHTIDWPLLVAAAERHRLAPLVFEGLSHFPSPPAVVRARLENIRNLELAKSVVRMHHVEELGEVAFRERLDLHLLKGAAFATTLYRDPGLRPMSDIDVLSSPAAFERWRRELEKLGYCLVDVSDHAICYRRSATGVLVELHRALTSASEFLGLDTRSLLERSRPFDGRLRTLSWEDHLLHLSLHASFQHGFRQAGLNAWDALTIAERDDFDVTSFVERARAARLAPWVYGGLAMTGAVFDGPRLAAIRRALEESIPRSIARKAIRFRPERLLGPSLDTVFGTPTGRLRWCGWNLTTFSLLWEISRPRPSETRQNLGGRPRRILQLLRNHGFTLSSSISSKTIGLSPGPTPASLGEVRDV